MIDRLTQPLLRTFAIGYSYSMDVVSSSRLRTSHLISAYVMVIGIVGLAIAVYGGIAVYRGEALYGGVPVYPGGEVVNSPQPLGFIILTLLIVITSITSTSMSLNKRISITYQIDSAIALSAIPFYGAGAAALLITISSLVAWIVKPTNEISWKKTRNQLLFNTGMMSISCAVAGIAFFETVELLKGYPRLLLVILPWIVASLVFNLVNVSLLIVMQTLQSKGIVSPFKMWKNAFATTSISVVVDIVGAAFIAYAIAQLSWVGIIVFFLPVVSSAYALYFYVRLFEAHMLNLEQIVDERTQALQAANGTLQQLNKEKSLFLAVLAHDMKSPLTTINLYGQMIRRKPTLMIERPRIAQTILDSQENLLEMVNNILDLERLDEGNAMPLNCEQFDLSEILDVLADRMDVQASSKSIELTFTYERGFLPIYGDRSQIRRVFANLISNGIKYTPQNGSVHVEADQDKEHLIVSVRDTGYGIPADALDTLFDRYSRVEKHRNKSIGTGLGLSITQAIVDAHNGTITVESEEDIGTTFTITLPITST